MENIKINIDDYKEHGLEDIYYSLMSFASQYVTTHYDPMETFKKEESQYAVAFITMKTGIKEILDYLRDNDEVYIPSLNRNIKFSTINFEELVALEERCKEYLLLKLEQALGKEAEQPKSPQQR